MDSFYKSDTFKNLGREVTELLGDYIEACNKRETMSVMPLLSPNEQLDLWKTDFKGENENQFIPLLQQLIKQSTHLHHPHFMGHQVSAPLIESILTSFAVSTLNNGMAVF